MPSDGPPIYIANEARVNSPIHFGMSSIAILSRYARRSFLFQLRPPKASSNHLEIGAICLTLPFRAANFIKTRTLSTPSRSLIDSNLTKSIYLSDSVPSWSFLGLVGIGLWLWRLWWWLRTPDSVAVLRLAGKIQDGSARRMNLNGLDPQIEKCFKMNKLKAVCLQINSPGGSPVQSELIAKRIQKLASEKDLKVYAFIEDVGTSGGYWIACAANEIYATESSIVGGIGVRKDEYDFLERIKRFGIIKWRWRTTRENEKPDSKRTSHPETEKKLRTARDRLGVVEWRIPIIGREKVREYDISNRWGMAKMEKTFRSMQERLGIQRPLRISGIKEPPKDPFFDQTERNMVTMKKKLRAMRDTLSAMRDTSSIEWRLPTTSEDEGPGASHLADKNNNEALEKPGSNQPENSEVKMKDGSHTWRNKSSIKSRLRTTDKDEDMALENADSELTKKIVVEMEKKLRPIRDRSGIDRGLLPTFVEEMSRQDPDSERTEKSKAVHSHFVDFVKKSRGDRLVGEETHLFGGACWTGKEAVKLGLVDGLDDTSSFIKKNFGDRIQIVQFHPIGVVRQTLDNLSRGLDNLRRSRGRN